MESGYGGAPEWKFHRPVAGLVLEAGTRISGHASVFGQVDQGGDVVLPGAYAASLAALKAAGRQVRMLWQHDPGQPIGVWDEVREDDRGLWVSGRLLPEVARGAEAAALVAAGALDGLSIGYRTKRAGRDGEGRRLLAEVELWEVSLVTFPMLASARVQGKTAVPAGDAAQGLAGDGGLALLQGLTAALAEARRAFGRGLPGEFQG